MITNILLYVGSITFAIFLIQLIILLFFGDFEFFSGDGGDTGDGDGGDGDDGHGFFHYFSIKNIIHFLQLGSWTSYGFIHSGIPIPIALSFGIIAGIVFAAIMIYVYSLMSKLGANYEITFDDISGTEAIVTLDVDDKPGKIKFTFKDRIFYENAISLDGTHFKKNEVVTIAEYNNSTFSIF